MENKMTTNFGPESAVPMPADGSFHANYVYAVPIKEVFADETFNVRGAIKPLEVMELARDIEKNGLTQPITIQPYNRVPGKKFRIIAGHRRYAAHLQIHNATHIRSIIVEGLDDLSARVMNLTENLHRENLNILQEAQAIHHLQLAGWDQEQVGARVGKSRGWVQARFYLMELPQELQEAAAAGILTQQQIKELWSLKDYTLQIVLFKEMKDDKNLGRKKPSKADKLKSKKDIRSQEAIFEIQEKIQETFGRVDHPLAIVLGWAAGVIDDQTMHRSISGVAERAGKYWEVPVFAEL
jgi:ParB/RepB/Spo0J family partition protein